MYVLNISGRTQFRQLPLLFLHLPELRLHHLLLYRPVCRFPRKACRRNGFAYTQYVRRRVGSHLFLPESKRLSVDASHLEQPHRGIPSSLWACRPCCIFQPAAWPGSPRNRASVDSSRSSKDMLLMPRRGPPCGGNDSPPPLPNHAPTPPGKQRQLHHLPTNFCSTSR